MKSHFQPFCQVVNARPLTLGRLPIPLSPNEKLLTLNVKHLGGALITVTLEALV